MIVARHVRYDRLDDLQIDVLALAQDPEGERPIVVFQFPFGEAVNDNGRCYVSFADGSTIIDGVRTVAISERRQVAVVEFVDTVAAAQGLPTQGSLQLAVPSAMLDDFLSAADRLFAQAGIQCDLHGEFDELTSEFDWFVGDSDRAPSEADFRVAVRIKAKVTEPIDSRELAIAMAAHLQRCIRTGSKYALVGHEREGLAIAIDGTQAADDLTDDLWDWVTSTERNFILALEGPGGESNIHNLRVEIADQIVSTAVKAVTGQL
jgi:hypothetical protein